MPVITVAPNNDLLEKLKSNLQEVRARRRAERVRATRSWSIQPSDGVTVITDAEAIVTYFQARMAVCTRFRRSCCRITWPS